MNTTITNTVKMMVWESPDQYRGELSCVGFCNKAYTIEKTRTPEGERVQVHAVTRKHDKKHMGYLHMFYGCNGAGKVSASVFHPAPGVELVWLENN